MNAPKPSLPNAADLMAQIDERRAALETANAQDRDAIDQARMRIAARKAELDALPVARRRRKGVE